MFKLLVAILFACGVSAQGAFIDAGPSAVNPGNSEVGGQTYQSDVPSQTCSSATITGNWDGGNVQSVDLQGCSGNITTVTWTNPRLGATLSLKIVQSSTARTITWPAAVKWVSGVTPVLSSTNDAIDLVTCLYDGTNYLCNILNGFA